MKANGQFSHRLLGFVLVLLLLVGATMATMPSAPTLAGPPEPEVPQPEPFFIRLDQPLVGGGTGGTTISTSQVHVAVPGGTWYDLMPTQGFDGGVFPPENWSVSTESGAGWGQQTAQHVSGSYSAGVATTATGTLDTWLVYGGDTGFSLVDVADAELKFSYWLDTEPSGGDPVYFGWAASPDGQSFYGARISGSVGQWLTGELDLKQYVNDDSVWFAFFVSGTSTSGSQEVYVDDVTVRAMEPYKVYLPTTARNFTATFTFTDNFSNLGSGWPHQVNWGSSAPQQQNVYGYTDKLIADYPSDYTVIGGDCRQAGTYFMRVGSVDHGDKVIAKGPVQAEDQFTLEADIAFCDNEPFASAGVLFGINDAGNEYYRVILIYDAGGSIKYAIWRNDSIILKSTSSSGHLKWEGQGFNTNRVKVVRDGCSISVFFNDGLAWSTTSECHYTDQRWVGLFHDKFPGSEKTGAVVDNFVLEGALSPGN